MRLESLLLPLAYPLGSFFIAEATLPVLVYPLAGGYESRHRIMWPGYSLRRRAVGRHGDPYVGRDAREPSPGFDFWNPANSGRHIK
jgi:hypothetical protein